MHWIFKGIALIHVFQCFHFYILPFFRKDNIFHFLKNDVYLYKFIFFVCLLHFALFLFSIYLYFYLFIYLFLYLMICFKEIYFSLFPRKFLKFKGGGCCERQNVCIFDISFLQKIPNPVLSRTKHCCFCNKSNHCAFSTALPMSYIDT